MSADSTKDFDILTTLLFRSISFKSSEAGKFHDVHEEFGKIRQTHQNSGKVKVVLCLLRVGKHGFGAASKLDFVTIEEIRMAKSMSFRKRIH